MRDTGTNEFSADNLHCVNCCPFPPLYPPLPLPYSFLFFPLRCGAASSPLPPQRAYRRNLEQSSSRQSV